MKKLQTKLQKLSCDEPTKLDVLRELDKRGALDGSDLDEYERLEKGYAGERKVLEYIEEFGRDHWMVLRNVWFEHFGRFEGDIVLATRAQHYTIEVKHYSGNIVFEDGICKRNGVKIGQNAIAQTQKVAINYQSMLTQNGMKVPVTGITIFTGDHCHVTVEDEINGVEVLMLNQLREFLWQIAREEDHYYAPSRVDQRVFDIIEQYEIENPFRVQPVSDEVKKKIQPGIICAHCGSFDIELVRHYFICDCGMHEPRETAIVRTICEYGVIHFDEDLTTSGLEEFFGGLFHARTIKRILNKYFNKIGATKGTSHPNFALPFRNISNNFNLLKSSYRKL